MKKWQKVNLFVFFIAVFVMAFLAYFQNFFDFSSPFEKPWHLLPSVHEDSLSQKYMDDCKVLNQKSLLKQCVDSSQVKVFILVDAWGVAIDENLLKTEFEFFSHSPHEYAIHQRLANRTKHAERVEFRDGHENKMYLFGGDSMEYDRLNYIPEIGFNRMQFCQKCDDSVMLSKIDSLLENDSLRLIAWTTQSSRSGDKDSLHKSLKMIAGFANRHPDVQIVVQGTHRPVLCDSKIRNSYKSHWVPVVILNKKGFCLN